MGSNLPNLLRTVRPLPIIGVGYHLTTCVKETLIHAAQEGYDVLLPIDLCGEGDRGRNLSEQQKADKKQAALARMAEAGVQTILSRDLH